MGQVAHPTGLSFMKRLLIFISIMFVLAGLSGCKATPYQKLGTTPAGGYYDRPISDDTFYVRFSANRSTCPKVVRRYLYRRAAEVTLENGFVYFTVIRGPEKLTQRMDLYPSEDYYRDMERPIEVNVPSSTNLKMTIQCFTDKPERTETPIFDAQEYLEK
jgi:hypothetical protein